MSTSPQRVPSFAASTARIFDLSLGGMLASRRTLFLALLAGAPVMLALVSRVASGAGITGALVVNGAPVGGEAVYGLMIWLVYVRFIVPVLGVFYGTSLIADEVEDRTITYLFTRPIPRAAVLTGKYLAYLACTVLLVLPSALLVFFLLAPGQDGVGAQFPLLVADLGMLAAGLAAYGAVFAWVGARVPRPLVAGLVFALGWEPAVLVFPGYLKRLTVAWYLQGLVPHALPQDDSVSSLLQSLTTAPPVLLSLLVLAGVSVAGVWAAGAAVSRREYVLEQ